MNIKIFCDSADFKIIKKFAKKKLVKGFTTNPSLMRNAGAKNYKKYSLQLLNVCNQKPISFEVFSDNFKDVLKQANIISSWGKNVYVKIPVISSKNIFMGKVISELNQKNIKINITAVYNFVQVKKILKLLNKKSKVIISIFAGRAGRLQVQGPEDRRVGARSGEGYGPARYDSCTLQLVEASVVGHYCLGGKAEGAR